MLTTNQLKTILESMGWEIITMAQYGNGDIRVISFWRANANFPMVDEIRYSPKSPFVISLYQEKKLVDTVAITY